MRFLGLSGSARRDSTNTALLRAAKELAPEGSAFTIYDGVGRLPVFSPDLEGKSTPPEVKSYIDLVARSDGVIVSSPEYVRSLPGGLKNAIDWLAPRDTLVGKPIALMHASHRGDDMLDALRIVLATVSDRFASDIFLRFSLVKMTPAEIAEFVAQPQNAQQVQNFLRSFARFCASPNATDAGSP